MSSLRIASFLLVVAGVVYATKTCNVLDHGGIADNATDLGPAIISAFTDCVAGATTSDPADTVLLVPPGIYALESLVTLNYAENCTVKIDGELHLVFNPELKGNMFLFFHFVLKGNGKIYGHGDLWRSHGQLGAYPARPRLLRFQGCNNMDISGLTLVNSPLFHVTIVGDNNVVHDMQIVADHIGATDAFDVSGNNNHVHDVVVENGDECVTVKSPTNGFVAENILCYYSGGCGIGSFGENSTGVSVQNVFYRNVTLQYGNAGIFLKSYPSASGIVRNVTYEDFTFVDVAYPIVIDGYWCGGTECGSATGDLAWKDIVFRRITGSGDSTHRPTVRVICPPERKCTGLVFEDVALTKEDGVKPTTVLQNACGNGLQGLPIC